MNENGDGQCKEQVKLNSNINLQCKEHDKYSAIVKLQCREHYENTAAVCLHREVAIIDDSPALGSLKIGDPAVTHHYQQQLPCLQGVHTSSSLGSIKRLPMAFNAFPSRLLQCKELLARQFGLPWRSLELALHSVLDKLEASSGKVGQLFLLT